MSINGVLQNAKWPDFVLTETKNTATVDGQSFVKTDNQRWIGEYNYEEKGRYFVSIKNKDSGNYLAWDANMKVVMNGSKYWWKLVFHEGLVGFQVPEKKSASDSQASAKPTSFYTLELEADHSVVLKYQESDLIEAQLWKVVPK
ncbi:hypothetical protein CY34DRAFT_17947 [Suillus luteus UH-Slu-Lm8-n1]|uniref:Uncharacterized protein n=1 Tax=Suillus luteus UH-Slu-Lm8-n1 TaxID=930992 RepID=A0A0D0A7I3_9AGAM|nr:hypothetical protein CY34DRAFT_17947 [Suillus luteus UH-Slu-Lm8-n1]